MAERILLVDDHPLTRSALAGLLGQHGFDVVGEAEDGEEAIERATELAEAADLMLCVGSSLAVHPVAGLPQLTLERGGRLAIVTKGRTPYDAEAEVRLGGEVDEELGALVEALG